MRLFLAKSRVGSQAAIYTYRKNALGSALVLLLCLSPISLIAQAAAQSRLAGAVASGQFVALKGSVHPLAQSKYDTGPVSGTTKLAGMSLDFNLSASQQSDLQELLQQQQTPGSANYHVWLTPAQFASRFGMTSDDLGKVEVWLQSQGLQVDAVSPSRMHITFSGSVAQIDSAFQTQLHHYQVAGVTHIANATPVSVPAAISGVVLGVRGLTDFRPTPKYRPQSAAAPRYSIGGYNYLAPADFAEIYDVNPVYNSGYTGAGKTLVVVGQSAIEASDVANFRSASGLAANVPTMTLVPDSGTSEVYASTGDESESDIDVEWSGAVAKAATVNFVYVGSDQNTSVFTALQYAIENDLAPVISISYGDCEADEETSDVSSLETLFQQANSQGQTVLAAAGDEGAADCDYSASTPGGQSTIVDGDEATQGLAVDYPGSSPYVTAVGGTEFDEGSGTYWNGSNGTGGASATNGYIPGMIWNDTSKSNGILAGGGGKSTLFTKPTWQTGNGVPADGARDVPDYSLNASPDHDGYVYCSTGQDSTSCANGFLDSHGDPTVAGGTSFGGPTSAGLLTLLNQESGSAGQGNLNPSIYSAAASTATAFHDITVGSNAVPCEIGTPDCTTGSMGYSATVGYDLASGWGAVDAANLGAVFAGLTPTTTTSPSFALSAAAFTVAPGSSGTSTITITPSDGYTGTVTVTATLPSTLTNSCDTISPPTVTISGTTAGSTMLTLYTSSSACSTAALRTPNLPAASGVHTRRLGGLGVAFASVLLLGFPARRRRGWQTMLSVLCLGVLSLGVLTLGIGCGGGASSTSSTSTSTSGTGTTSTGTSTTAPAGPYPITVTGKDSNGLTVVTSFQLTVS